MELEAQDQRTLVAADLTDRQRCIQPHLRLWIGEPVDEIDQQLLSGQEALGQCE